MSSYQLDYTDAAPAPAVHQADKLLVRTNVLVAAGTIAVFSVSMAGNFFYHSQHQRLRQEADRQALQYDSLLSAKLQTDQKIVELRAQLTQLKQHQQEPPHLSPATSITTQLPRKP